MLSRAWAFVQKLILLEEHRASSAGRRPSSGHLHTYRSRHHCEPAGFREPCAPACAHGSSGSAPHAPAKPRRQWRSARRRLAARTVRRRSTRASVSAAKSTASRTVEHGDRVIRSERVAPIPAIYEADPAHVGMKLGGAQRAHAGGADDRNAPADRPENLLVPHRRLGLEAAIHDHDGGRVSSAARLPRWSPARPGKADHIGRTLRFPGAKAWDR